MIINPYVFLSPPVVSTGPLLHLDGANASTAIVDAHAGSTWTASGAAQLSTVQAKFGPSSLFVNTGYVFTTNMGSTLSANFCVEGWAYAIATPRGIFHLFPNSTATSLGLGWDNAGNRWQLYNSGTVTNSATTTVPVGWFHWAVYRVGTALMLAINGVVIITVTNSTDFGGYSSLYVGIYYNSGFPWVGYIDEVRVTLASSPYTSAGFTPPTAPFT
jgi:hypothetical protein